MRKKDLHFKKIAHASLGRTDNGMPRVEGERLVKLLYFIRKTANYMAVMEDGQQKGIELSESVPLLILVRLQRGQENHSHNKY